MEKCSEKEDSDDPDSIFISAGLGHNSNSCPFFGLRLPSATEHPAREYQPGPGGNDFRSGPAALRQPGQMETGKNGNGMETGNENARTEWKQNRNRKREH